MIRLTRLRVNDFRVLHEADVELDRQGLVLIRGINDDTNAADSNGSGKTTLFDALSWCLYGQTVAEGKVTDVARVGAPKAVVKVDFEDGDRRYTVERSRSSSATNLKLLTDGSSTTARAAKDTQATIEDILGLDWHAFKNTVLYGQGDIRRFADAETTDAERKSILKRILRLDVLDKALAEVRERAKEIKIQFGVVQEKVKTAISLEAEVRTAFTKLVATERDWAVDRDDRADTVQTKIIDVETRMEECRVKADQASRLQTVKVGFEDEMANLPILHDRRSATETTLAKARESTHTATLLVERANAEITAIKLGIKRAEDEVTRIRNERQKLADLEICPVCRTPTAQSEHTQAHLDEMEQLAVEAGKPAQALRKMLDEWQATLTERQQVLKDAKTNASAVQAALLTIEADIKDLKALEPSLKKAQRAYEEAKEASNKSRMLDAVLSEHQDRLRDIRAETNPHGPGLVDLETRLVQLETDRLEHETDALAVAKELDHHRFWDAGFGNKGLPAMVMDGILPLIAETANQYLITLADGDIQVTISPVTANKGEGEREEISITLDIEGLSGVRPSAGQRRKVSVAIDLALMDLVSGREEAQMAFLMLDEVLDGLDGEGKARVVELLKFLSTTKETVLVVSHDPSIQEHFEKTLVVQKSGQSSEVYWE